MGKRKARVARKLLESKNCRRKVGFITMRATQCREYKSKYLIFFNFLNQEG